MFSDSDLRGFFPRERFRREFRYIPLRAAVHELRTEASSEVPPQEPVEQALASSRGIQCPFAPGQAVGEMCPYSSACEGDCMLLKES